MTPAIQSIIEFAINVTRRGGIAAFYVGPHVFKVAAVVHENKAYGMLRCATVGGSELLIAAEAVQAVREVLDGAKEEFIRLPRMEE